VLSHQQEQELLSACEDGDVDRFKAVATRLGSVDVRDPETGL